MRRLALFLVLGGCAHGSSARAPSTLAQIGWSGAPPRVNVQLAGPNAGGERQSECNAGVARAGAIADGNAPMLAVVTLGDHANRVELLSPRRGVVKSESRPLLPVAELCAQAAVAAASIVRDDAGGSPFESQSSFVLQPTTASDSHAPGRQLGPAPSPQASGEQERGPIQ